MGAGASRPPIPATHPAGVAFRRKLEEIRRRRKVRAFRDSIVSTTELLKDRADLESVGDVARLSAVGFETDSAEQAKDDKPSGEKKEEAAVATTEAIASEPAGNVVAAEVKAETKEAGEIDEKKKVAEVVVTKKVEIAEAVTSLAAEVALLKIEEDGEEEEEEEEEDKDGSELTADLPGSPSFRYFVMINNQAGDSNDSDNNQEAAGGHGKDDDEEEGQDTKEVIIKNVDGEDGVEGEKLLSGKKKRKKMMVRIRARSLARGPVAMCTLLHVNACYSAPRDRPNAPRRRTSIRHILFEQSNKDKVASAVEERPSTSENAAAGKKPPTEEVATNEKPATNSSTMQEPAVA